MLVVNDLMTSRLHQFENILETELPFVVESFDLDEENQATLAGWVEMMKDWMAGILVWHQVTGRYTEPVLERTRTPGALISAASSGSHLGLSGLGTSAARIAGGVHAMLESTADAPAPAVGVLAGLGTSAASLGSSHG